MELDALDFVSKLLRYHSSYNNVKHGISLCYLHLSVLLLLIISEASWRSSITASNPSSTSKILCITSLTAEVILHRNHQNINVPQRQLEFCSIQDMLHSALFISQKYTTVRSSLQNSPRST